MDHRSKCKAKSIKLLNENIGINVYNLGLGSAFLDMTPKVWPKKHQKTKTR